jgi:spore maturation protein CgeB
VFAGHHEDDGRTEMLEAVIEAGLDLRIYGPEWEGAFRKSAILQRLSPPQYLGNESYNLVLNASKIVICFLSTLNRDTYTRRCFEVPAAGAFLLSQYSGDLATLFTEGKEIAFFRNAAELVEKIRHYLAHDDERRAIARAGRERVQRDGHDVVGRMREMLSLIDPLLAP